MSDRVVQYEGIDITLSVAEYVALKDAALNDPIEADRMARGFLARQSA